MTQTGITINNKQELYVIPEGNGYTTLGFDVCLEKVKSLSSEMLVALPQNLKRGSMKAYKIYSSLVNFARLKNKETGWRSQSELYPPFIGNEGRRVEVIYKDGTKERFYIGKSTGWIPCHLIIKRINSHSGGALLKNSIESFKFLSNKVR